MRNMKYFRPLEKPVKRLTDTVILIVNQHFVMLQFFQVRQDFAKRRICIKYIDILDKILGSVILDTLIFYINTDNFY